MWLQATKSTLKKFFYLILKNCFLKKLGSNLGSSLIDIVFIVSVLLFPIPSRGLQPYWKPPPLG